MYWTDRWTEANGVKLHYMETAIFDDMMTPLVYVPGALNHAAQATELLGYFKDRRRISMSLRGRGKSEAPLSGYAFKDHVTDIEAVVGRSGVTEYCLLAYSMGVPYAIDFAAHNPHIKGMILCDYPSKYPAFPEEWKARVKAAGFISEENFHVPEGIQRESAALSLEDQLAKIDVPVLVIRGEKDGSLLKDSDVEFYQKHLKDVRFMTVKDAGHELWEPDKENFIRLIAGFLKWLDKKEKFLG
ncbi:alpha/beta fold hydrolase [Planococcus sp. 107-1]|uniref:alpha/beta fold hydrolase n=1 Tax=Planococcus sp. 107-1 TaxID=2908840 RepID=UPI001F289AAB|nr:alpha/beta hydrolase [Planococcus sp. 107-1]UJF28122.1 alpha/beta hydrolase [Planococcus sp. 107-1]